MNLKLNSRQLFRLIYFIICFVICFYQNMKICENYFSFETLTTVRYINELRLSLPGITICLPKIQAIREGFKQKYPNITKNEELSNLTVREQFDATLSFQEITNNSCMVLKTLFSNSSNSSIPCEDITPVRKSLDYFFVCFTIFSQLSGESDERYIVDIDSFVNSQEYQLLSTWIALNFSKVNVAIHSRDQVIYEIWKTNFLDIDFKESVLTGVKYQKSSVKSLTKPYETNCFDFNTIGFNSRRSCLENCRLNHLQKHYNKQPGGFLSYKPSNRLLASLQHNVERDQFKDKVAKICREVCPSNIDCYREYFTIGKQEYNISYERINVHHFVVDIPELPELSVRHSPKVYFEEFVSFIGSLISLWFGFSIIMLSKLFLNFINFTIKTFSVKFSQNNKTNVKIHFHNKINHNTNVIKINR